ncbi:hypothetical protein K1T71_002915 [Dendrolimus kikuchii]|uniref:Uncharacterized protein n=1 Tax=Dendrolimus kikuchii TaxID=765133 RepID=A0ACC1DAH3_9NEOP|nr:hypothetical protein K1T71_002915 [Dendrolimus kikuchii]
MMVETILESSQDFGMSNGSLPQWKRELLQRRAARSRPVAPPPQPPPPPPPPPAPNDDEDEELRYGPGIVKRLKSRYLSLALRDAPRRRPSVLRRATSLEHLLDERPPPVPATRPCTAHNRPPRPASVAAPPAIYTPSPRRESMKRARSVDALSRLDSRDEPRQPSPSPPPPLAPRPPHVRAARPPRRPTPLLRETERPPPDVVRSTLRKFETAPTRRTAPAARVSAVLKGLEAPQRTSTPEPDAPDLMPRSPSPSAMAPPSPVPYICDTPPPVLTPSTPGSMETRQVSRAALEGIARAGSTTRYSFEAPRVGSHLPPLSATNPVLVGRARRIGVIRPMPSPTLSLSDTSPPREEITEKIEETNGRMASPPPELEQPQPVRTERKEPPPSAFVEPIPRVSEPIREESPRPETPPPRIPSPEPKLVEVIEPPPLVNGHGAPERSDKVSCVGSKIVAAGIERAWSGSAEKKVEVKEKKVEVNNKKEGVATPWGAQRKPRAPPPAATSVVFNFSDRKEVPDYIENDGIVLRANRRNRIKPGEPGVVVLRPEALVRPESDSEDEADCGPPSPCGVKFVNDNVLINGKSSMTAKPNRDRIAKLKLQFDDSLTRTFEYPSETSLCEESPPSPTAAPAAAPAQPQCAESPLHATLAANTHITSAALSRYTPSKTLATSFQLGVTRQEPVADVEKPTTNGVGAGGAEEEACGGDARPCGADAARSWSESRTNNTDLLF